MISTVTYASIEEANEYLKYHLASMAWDKADDTRKTAALVTATNKIDQLPLKGYMKEEGQERRFPRDYQADYEIPLPIQHATIELALSYLQGLDPQKEYNLLTIAEAVYGSIREKRRIDLVAPHIVAGIPSLRAFELVLPYLRDEEAITLAKGS